MKNKMNAMQDTINEAAELIAQYDPALANLWKSQPFNRVSMAYAFASGFAKDESDDIHPTAELVLRVALLDREMRKEAA